MAYKFIGNNAGGFQILAGTSAERTAITSGKDFAPGTEFRETDHPGDIYVSDGVQWNQISTGGADLVKDTSTKAEQQQQVYSFSGAPAAMGQTPNIAGYGFPFQIFKFTKSAAVENPAVRLCLNGRGVAFLTIAGLTAETIAVTSLVDGTNESAVMGWRKSDGTFVTALGNGTYTLAVQ